MNYPISYATVAHSSQIRHVLALHQSIQKVDSGAVLHVLLTSGKYPEIQDIKTIQWYKSSEIEQPLEILFLKLKYKWRKKHCIFSGVLKPYFLKYLIAKLNTNLILCNPDGFFYNDPIQLKSALENHSVALIPNDFSLDPNEPESTFLWYFSRGYYTSGIIGFRHDATVEINWWVKVCRYACEENQMKAFYYEQAYLNFLPIMYESPKVLVNQSIYCGIGKVKQLSTDNPAKFDFIHYDGEVIAILSVNTKHPLFEKWVEYQKLLIANI